MPGSGEVYTRGMASTETPAGFATEADLLALPEKPGAELIDGVIVYKPAPSWEHSDFGSTSVTARATTGLWTPKPLS